MPFARRALKSWERLAVTGEGEAIPWEGLAAIADEGYRMGLDEIADEVLVRADCYLRAQDARQLRGSDVDIDERLGVVLQLGVPERGESAKTGVRQGVRVDREGVADILRRRETRVQA